MHTTSRVANLIQTLIHDSKKLQKDIAEAAGFDNPNILTMIKQGRTKLPIARATALAKALEANPVQLIRLCLEEYQPDNWKDIHDFLESSLSDDELTLIRGLREWIGAPHLAALTPVSKRFFDQFMNSLREPTAIH